jgi:anti-sigma factor RsiW
MNCNEFKSNIDLFIDGELDDKETAEFEIHFTSCKDCHMELESLEKCSKVLRGLLKAENPPQSIKNNVFRELDKNT